MAQTTGAITLRTTRLRLRQRVTRVSRVLGVTAVAELGEVNPMLVVVVVQGVRMRVVLGVLVWHVSAITPVGNIWEMLAVVAISLTTSRQHVPLRLIPVQPIRG